VIHALVVLVLQKGGICGNAIWPSIHNNLPEVGIVLALVVLAHGGLLRGEEVEELNEKLNT
jgi:hypothetical protein